MTKQQSKWVWIVPVMLLSLSYFHLPYGFYTLLRIVVTGVAAYLAYLEYDKSGGSINLFVVLFSITAVLFNPVIPIHLKRSVWAVIDFLAIVLFLVHMAIFFRNKID